MPDSFEALEGTIKATYERLVKEGALVPQPDTPAPSVPLDLEAAKKAGKVHPAGFPAPGSSRRRPVTIRYLFSTPAHRSCRRQLVPVMQVRGAHQHCVFHMRRPRRGADLQWRGHEHTDRRWGQARTVMVLKRYCSCECAQACMHAISL